MKPGVAGEHTVWERLEEQLNDVLCVALGIEVTDTRRGHAAILTIGNEVVSGDTENTNASWLGRRLGGLGLTGVPTAAMPAELDPIVSFLPRQVPARDELIL